MAEYAMAQGAEVIGWVRWRGRTENIEHLRGKIRLIECDVREAASGIGCLRRPPQPISSISRRRALLARRGTCRRKPFPRITGPLTLLEGIREIPSASEGVQQWCKW